MTLSAAITKARLAHKSGAGFHLTDDEMTLILDAAARSVQAPSMTLLSEEQVARAICRAHELEDGFDPEQADKHAASEMYRNFLPHARAVLTLLQSHDGGAEGTGPANSPEHTPSAPASPPGGTVAIAKARKSLLEIERLCGCPAPNLTHIKAIAHRTADALSASRIKKRGQLTREAFTLGYNAASREQSGLVKALEDVLTAEADFRRNMPSDWEGDPLTDACARARAALAAHAKQEGES